MNFKSIENRVDLFLNVDKFPTYFYRKFTADIFVYSRNFLSHENRLFSPFLFDIFGVKNNFSFHFRFERFSFGKIDGKQMPIQSWAIAWKIIVI